MSNLNPLPEKSQKYTFEYYYLAENNERHEAILESHSNDNLANIYISHISFKEFANNLGINLEEFHYKYSPVSEICRHGSKTSERCYNLSAVFSIFTELNAGMVLKEEGKCCYSNLPLCSEAFRDRTYWTRVKEYGSALVNGNESCLLNFQSYCFTSRQRLITRGDILCKGNKEFTLENNPSESNHWLRYFKKRERSTRKLLRLDKQKSLIYGERVKTVEYY
jgi:hypothetical protein